MSDTVQATLTKALRQLEAQRATLDRQIAALQGIVGGPQPKAATKSRKRPARKGMTAAQKKAVSRRMKKYWADRRKAAKAKK